MQKVVFHTVHTISCEGWVSPGCCGNPMNYCVKKNNWAYLWKRTSS